MDGSERRFSWIQLAENSVHKVVFFNTVMKLRVP